MTDTPSKPASSGSAEAVAWNLHQAGLIEAKVSAIHASLQELVSTSAELVTGGSSVEWEVAWSHIRFAERMLRAWQLNTEVSRRTSEERFGILEEPPVDDAEVAP